MDTDLLKNKAMFYINSNNRTSGTNSSFDITIDIPRNRNFKFVGLTQAIIPKSYYMVSLETGNIFTVQDTTNGTVQIEIQIGNYTRTSFRRVLKDLLNANSTFTYEMTFPGSKEVDDGLYTWSVTNNASVQPKFIFSDTSLHEQFGFDKNSTNTFASDILKSQNVVKFQREDALFIHSSIVNNETSVLQDIAVSADFVNFSNITYKNRDVSFNLKKISYTDSNSYNFSLTDEDGVILDLNGLNINFTLVLV